MALHGEIVVHFVIIILVTKMKIFYPPVRCNKAFQLQAFQNCHSAVLLLDMQHIFFWCGSSESSLYKRYGEIGNDEEDDDKGHVRAVVAEAAVTDQPIMLSCCYRMGNFMSTPSIGNNMSTETCYAHTACLIEWPPQPRLNSMYA